VELKAFSIFHLNVLIFPRLRGIVSEYQ